MVQTPTARLLELLERLQTQPLTTGTEIADRLGIDRRTVRRYVTALQDLGIPVEGQRGVGGGCRIRPGYRLPPLMLDDDEAVVVALGVIAAGRLGLTASSESVDGALAKIRRVLPDGLRRRVEALETTLDFTTAAPAGAPVTGEVRPAAGRRDTEAPAAASPSGRSRATTPSRAQPPRPRGSLRTLVPGGARPRDDLRTFRVDRIRRAALVTESAVTARTGSTSWCTSAARLLARPGRTRSSHASPPARRGGKARPRRSQSW